MLSVGCEWAAGSPLYLEASCHVTLLAGSQALQRVRDLGFWP